MKKVFKLERRPSLKIKYDLKMKLTTLLLIVSLFQTYAKESYAQKTKISLELENVSIEKVLVKIETLTEFRFLYSDIDFDYKRKVSLKSKREKVSSILKKLFLNSNITFEVMNKQIILVQKSDKDIELIPVERKVLRNDQKKEISGVVKDSKGTPLPGVNIVIVGLSRGTETDFDGKYSLVIEKGSVLEFSYIGMKTIRKIVGDSEVLDVVLEDSSNDLEEVIVVGYGTQKKSDLTGAVVSLKATDFAAGTNDNAIQLLNGSASGVKVSQVSSAPGSSLKIQVRGAGSINSSNGVLFVIDGLPGVDPNSISPDDIESIEVLKDASSASIYGTRAANGVVLITTKKGKSGKLTLGYNSYIGMQNVAKQLDVLNASDYMKMINFREGNTVYSPTDIANAGTGTNWQDEIFRTALVKNHQITMSGGNDKGNYYIGLNYFHQDGVVRNSSYKKYNARFNVEFKPYDNFNITTNLNVNHGDRRRILFSNGANEAAGPINSAIQYDPTIVPTLSENGAYFRNDIIALDNPVALINGYSNQSLATKVYGSITTNYEFVPNLTATLRMGAELTNSRGDTYRNRLTLNGGNLNGRGSISASDNIHWLTEGLLTYKKTFNEKHDLTILAGATWENFFSRNVNASTYGFLSDVTLTNLLQSGDGENGDSVSSGKWVNKLNGFLGRINYGFDGKYLFTASLRVDGSSRFSDKNKYAAFPSGSLAWRFDKESFMEDVEWINLAKLRVGYGQLGNQGIGNFATIHTLVARGNAVFNGNIEQGVVSARLPNPDLKWETTQEFNVGIDYGFFNNRISGSVDYFNRKTKDQLFNKPLPSVVGFTSILVNLGEVVNKGVDVSIKTDNIRNGDFNWASSATVSFLKNEVTKLPDFTEEIISGSLGTFINQYTIVREGTPLRSYYGYEVDGIFQVGDDIANSPTPGNNSNYAPGMPKFVDQNNDGIIDSDDRVILGDPFPDISYGVNNRFSYKGVSLDVLIVGVQGIETIDGNVTESLYPTNSARNSISTYFLDRWTPENPTNKLPSGENPSLYGGARAINSFNIVDASFVRLKNITLGYDVPFAEKIGLSSLNVYVAADNLLTITNFDGFDPDASSNGGGVVKQNYNSYPLARTVRLGVNVKF